MSRWVLFLITLALGAAGGLYYGWVVNPVEYVNTTPDTLRSDYKTDYVLMVAEIYHSDNDLMSAVHSLTVLGGNTPSDTVTTALEYARQPEHPYAESDLALMQALLTALKGMNPVVGAVPGLEAKPNGGSSP